jgi:hypothetical protein
MIDGEVAFDMGEAFDAIEAAQEPDTSVEVIDTPDDMPEVVNDRERDESGRFKAKEAVEPESEVVEPIAEPVIEPVEAAPEVAEPDEALRLPKEIRDEWKTLSEPVRTALEKREREIHDVVTRVDRERQVGRTFDTSIEEYKATIEQAGGTPMVAIRNLLETAKVLYQGTPEQKASMLNMIATQYGIDIEQAYYNRPDPAVARLEMQNSQQANQLAGYAAVEAREQSTQMDQHISEWAKDKPHFDQVMPEMERLARAGVSTDLTTLYNMAISTDDTLRSTSIEQAVTTRLAEETAKQAAAVAKAKRGAVSPPSASGHAKPPGSANLSNLEAMSLAYDEIAARNSG